MKKILSSIEGLEQLCKLDSERKITRIPITKIVGGSLLGSIGAGVGYLVYNNKVNENAIGTVDTIIVAGFAAAMAGLSVRLIGDGLSYLGRIITEPTCDGNFYQRDGILLHKHRTSDRFFGKQVVPLESIDELNEGLFFLNGAYLKKVSETKTTYTVGCGGGSIGMGGGCVRVEHSVNLEIEHKQHSLPVHFSSSSLEDISRLKKIEEEKSLIYILASTRKKFCSLRTFGEALMAR